MIKKIIIKIFILTSVLSILFTEFSFSQQSVQKSLSDNPAQLRKYVTDETGTLTPSQINSLNSKLSNEDKTNSNQIIVYMIPSLEGESLEDVSIRLAEKNKIGKKDKNNGVLLLIVKNDRKIRIEVGYGLEGSLTDAKSSSIIRNEITPEFKSGRYYEGINKGVDAIISVIKGEYTSEKNKDNQTGGCCFGIPIFIVIIFAFIFISIFSSFLKNFLRGGRILQAGKSGWGVSSGGWGGGSWGGGSSSGGGGGFSGGGGSFGGGGASGSW